MPYFAATKAETENHKAGTIFRVWSKGSTVYAATYNFGNNWIEIGEPSTYTKEMARRLFTSPSTDIDSVIEESIMICEATYC